MSNTKTESKGDWGNGVTADQFYTACQNVNPIELAIAFKRAQITVLEDEIKELENS